MVPSEMETSVLPLLPRSTDSLDSEAIGEEKWLEVSPGGSAGEGKE